MVKEYAFHTNFFSQLFLLFCWLIPYDQINHFSIALIPTYFINKLNFESNTWLYYFKMLDTRAR